MKKFRCTVCGYVYEGDEAPEFCPQCKQPRSKFKEVVESDELDFVTEHHIGDGVVEDAEVMEGLKAHFMGECTEVGMYLAMSRQAAREGYPEVAEAFKRYAWEEAEHAAKFAELLGDVVWDTKTNLEFLTEVLEAFNTAGIRTSVFVSTDAEMIEYAAKAGADRVELYTEPYATAFPKGKEAAVAPFVEAAKIARSLGLGLNAGHDLSLENLNYFYKNIPWLDEVSIGHALISDALYLGLERTIQEYKNCLR